MKFAPVPPFAASRGPLLQKAAAVPNYEACYINLDRSPERRRDVEQQLQTYHLSERYTRLPAVDGQTLAPRRSPLTPGEVGCFISHYEALARIKSRRKCVHIIEDDIVMSEYMVPMINAAIENSVFDQFDIVFTDSLTWPNILMLKTYLDIFAQFQSINPHLRSAEHFHILSLGEINFNCSTSYVVSPKAIDRMLGYYKKELASGPALPLDLFLRSLTVARKLRVGCFFPFVTSIRLEHVAGSTIEVRAGQLANPAVLLSHLLRYSFFVNRDLEVYGKPLLEAVQRQVTMPNDAHREFTATLLGLMLSPQSRQF